MISEEIAPVGAGLAVGITLIVIFSSFSYLIPEEVDSAVSGGLVRVPEGMVLQVDLGNPTDSPVIDENTNDGSTNVGGGEQIMTSWRGYGSLQSMVYSSTDIIVGHVIGLEPGPPGPLPTIAVDVVVDTVLKGKSKANDTLTVTQITSPFNTWISVEEPLMEEGKEYVLFLIYIPETGNYSTGGPQGLYVIDDAKVTSVHGNSPTSIQEEPLLDFLSNIETIIAVQ